MGFIKAIVWILKRFFFWVRQVVKAIIKAIAWLLTQIFFLVHWAFRITSGVLLSAVFVAAFLCIALEIHDNYGILIDFIEAKEGKIITYVSSFIVSFLGVFNVLNTQMLKEYIKKLYNNFKKLFFPPEIKVGGLTKTGEELKQAIGSIIESGGLLLLLAAVLLATMASSAGIATGDTYIERNNYHLYVDNKASVPVNCPDNKSDKPSLFTLKVLFQDEAKLEDWLDRKNNRKYEKDCLYSQGSQNASNIDSCAVKPDKHDYTPIFLALLKGLSACGSSGQKVRLEIVGFSSSSGVLSTLKTADDDIIKAIKERKLCYERTNDNGNENQRLSNAFNLCIAELRAENVADMLKEIIASDKTISSDHIEVAPYKWKTYSEMCRQRGFSDTKKEGECYDPDLGLKNRRTDVWVTKIPECTNFSPANGIHACEAETQMPPDPQGETCGQSASPAVCSRNPDITNQP